MKQVYPRSEAKEVLVTHRDLNGLMSPLECSSTLEAADHKQQTREGEEGGGGGKGNKRRKGVL